MGTEILTERERQVLEYLKQAQELDSTLTDYSVAFKLNVHDLYAGKAQLQRKGFWPAKNAEGSKPELLAVQVPPEPKTNDALVCRLMMPGGWTIECTQWPQAQWIAQVMGATQAVRS